MEKLKFTDMEKLRKTIVDLLNRNRIVIMWDHIRSLHRVREHEIRAALRHGSPLRPDRDVEARYLVWSRLTETGKLIRVAFEVREVDGAVLVVVTAFEEESR